MAGTSKGNPAELQALDSAIAEVARENASRLRNEIPSEQWSESIDNALDSLTRLQTCEDPDWDLDWLNVFYISWYQPRQIHLAYVALRKLLERRHPLPPRYVVDYGCGAWAVQIALAMILAEKPELQGAGIAVHGVDSSESMKRIGKELWSMFLKIVRERRGHFQKLHDAMKSMEDFCIYHATIEDAAAAVQDGRTDGAPGDCWFAAIHAIYENKGRTQSNLDGILDTDEYRSMGFALELVTFYPRPHLESRFTGRGFRRNEEVTSLWSGTLQKTTDWRFSMSSYPGLNNTPLLDRRPTTWDLEEYAVMVRKKRRTGR